VTVGFALNPKIAARSGDSGKFNAGSGGDKRKRGESVVGDLGEKERRRMENGVREAERKEGRKSGA